MHLFARIGLVAILAAVLIFAGCAAQQQQPPVTQIKETTKIIYICPDGSEVSEKSICVLPVIPKCEGTGEGAATGGTANGSSGAGTTPKPDANACGGAKNASCIRGYYCKLDYNSKEGTCTKMVPVSITVTPPDAAYDYYLDGAWTGKFEVSNSGNTPIELYFTSVSKYITIQTNKTYLEPGQRAMVNYRLWFSDDKLPVGTNRLRIAINAPVDGFSVSYFTLTIMRRF